MEPQCIHEQFVAELKGLLQAKIQQLATLKEDQLTLRAKCKVEKDICDEIVDKLRNAEDSEKEDLTYDLQNRMVRLQFFQGCLRGCDKQLLEALEAHAEMMATKVHLELKHGVFF